jgi:hypothetical protein
MKRIVITFKPDGSSNVEAFGFEGDECLDATREIENAIGVAGNRSPKPEMQLASRVTLKT